MAKDSPGSRLFVEGPDDLHTIVHLLSRHDLPYGRGENRMPPAPWPELEEKGGVDRLIRSIDTVIKGTNGNHHHGFVLDANDNLESRWKRVVDRLLRAKVSDIPNEPPPGGFIGTSVESGFRVGVWIMPDNQSVGSLEVFLERLVDKTDALFKHAEESTAAAREVHGAGFSPGSQGKAQLHAWLAWQKEPGLPYGAAVKAQYFHHESPAALAFVAWFKNLFETS